MTFHLDQLVCECPDPATAPGFRWYEADLDDPRHVLALAYPSEPGPGAERVDDDPPPRLVASTRHKDADRLERVVDQVLLGRRVPTHVQVECAPGTPSRSIELVRDRGLLPVAALHSRTPPRSAVRLRSLVSTMADLGAAIVKLVYPVHAAAHVRWTVELLLDPPPGCPSLSLTPTGDRQARVAAALAGSSLVFAPLHTTSERMSAEWYRALAVPCQHLDEEVGSWFSNAVHS